jgi:hypothetical protein
MVPPETPSAKPAPTPDLAPAEGTHSSTYNNKKAAAPHLPPLTTAATPAAVKRVVDAPAVYADVICFPFFHSLIFCLQFIMFISANAAK